MSAEVITGIQIRGAMGILGWSVKDLARLTGLGTTTITNLKKEDGIKKTAEYETLEVLHEKISEGLAEKGLDLDEPKSGTFSYKRES